MFTKKTLDFLRRAGSQKSVDWLDDHKGEHRELIVEPMTELALGLLARLGRLPEARGYKFPVRGFGRLRRAKHKVARGGIAYRDFVHMSASRPSKSLFDQNPTLYFYMSPKETFAGAGMYEPSSRQVKQIRAWIDTDPGELVRLLKSRPFKTEFANGLETEKRVKTNPRAYSPDHRHIEWLRLQAYYVTQKFTQRELLSREFTDLLAESWKQGLRLNAVLDEALSDWNHTLAPAEDVASDESSDEGDAGGVLWDDRL